MSQDIPVILCALRKEIIRYKKYHHAPLLAFGSFRHIATYFNKSTTALLQFPGKVLPMIYSSAADHIEDEVMLDVDLGFSIVLRAIVVGKQHARARELPGKWREIL